MNQPLMVTAAQKAGPAVTTLVGVLVLLVLLALPLLSLLPADSPLQVSAYTLTLVGKILCYAIVALALDLVWGYAGLLSLGHGLFFALGGYAMGMYLMRQASGDELPAFMTFLSWTELPWYWVGTEHFWWAMCLVVLAPGLLALVFGFFAFRSRIKGVYFSIMTQALTFAGMLLFFRNETGFGGNNGFTNFRSILGFGITEPGTRAALFLATVLLLVTSLFLGWRLARSKFGRVLTALRDAENRLMFCGYDPRGFKLFVWVLSAVLCGLAGALYVPQVGIINPGEMSPTNSIEAAGHQHQSLLKRPQWITADAVVLAVDHKQPLVANFDTDFNFRVFQRNSGGTTLTSQLTADVFFDFHGRKRVLASALAAHRKDLTRQRFTEVQFALGNDVVEIAQRVLIDLQEMRNARHAAQAIGHFLQGFGVTHARLQLDVVPHACHHHSRVQIAEHGTDVFGQLTDETHPNRTALDRDFGEDFND